VPHSPQGSRLRIHPVRRALTYSPNDSFASGRGYKYATTLLAVESLTLGKDLRVDLRLIQLCGGQSGCSRANNRKSSTSRNLLFLATDSLYRCVNTVCAHADKP
jgi:hypothetical protein